jgi:hypothetical protein
MAGVLINNDKEEKLSSEIRKWKNKYLVRSDVTFHAVDFFEDFKSKYRKIELDNPKIFYKAVIELVTVFLSVTYEAKVFYIDLKRLRKDMNFDRYITGKQRILKDIFNKEYSGNYLQPISTILEKFFLFHENYIKENKKTGYVCFESQKEFDEQTIKTFHKTLQAHRNHATTYKYGREVLGIHFYTKASLCAALELSDFIAYCSTQHLRLEQKSTELKIKSDRLQALVEAYRSIKQRRKIYLRNCTLECINELKSIHKPQNPKKKTSG